MSLTCRVADRPQFLGCITAALLFVAGGNVWSDESAVSVTAKDGKFQVLVGNDLFCEVDYQTYEKPIVYPIYGPGQIPMTRNYPMQKDVHGEATDHPHHKSMWFGHGDVNGVSFWHEQGTIQTEQADILAPADTGGQFGVRLENRLVGPDGETVARETMELRFDATDSRRWIDWEVTVHASEGDLVFGDTKEGTAALRVHPNLRLSNDPRRGVTTANGRAMNSAGDQGADVWGKRAKWVDYSGTIDGQPVGISFLDHPENLRHPSYWHARTYGLFAANPFGLSYFVDDSQDGSHQVAAGDVLRLKYRLVFHRDHATRADVDRLFDEFAP